MNCLEEYINYLKDNPEGYWFKRKLYGYGWTPARKEGWVTLGAYLLLVFLIIFPNEEALAATQIVSLVLVVTGVFLLICFKTGESLKWQWGRDKIKE